MKLYHGTSKNCELDLINGRVDVTKGGGEFGQGFYTSNKVYLVSAWSWHKFKQKMSVITYDVDDSKLMCVRIKQLSQKQATNKRKDIQKRQMKRKLVFEDYDLVIGPVVGKPYANYLQFVFVGPDGQVFINNQKSELLWKK